MTGESVGPHHGQPLLRAGAQLSDAEAAMILVHGRGATAENILELASLIHDPRIAYLAPQAAGNTWYPYSFLAPLQRNEPGLSSGLAVIGNAVRLAIDHGISARRIIIGGFSQGACLATEYVARNGKRFGGLLTFSGGLIGPLGMQHVYDGSLDGTPVFLGCSNRDAHIPLERVEETAAVLSEMAAEVVMRIYPDMGHTIIDDELEHASAIVDALFTD